MSYTDLLDESTSPIPRLSVPMAWPLDHATYVEYEKAKIRQSTGIMRAVVQLRDETKKDREAIGISVQGIHDRGTKTLVAVDNLVAIMKAMADTMGQHEATLSTLRDSIQDTAEQMGRLASDLYGYSEDARTKFDSFSDQDKEHSKDIAVATMSAARARLEADRANDRATAAEAVAALARTEAELAKKGAELAKKDAEIAKKDAELAKAESATSKLVAVEAKKMSSWRALSLLGAGPALYGIFTLIYQAIHS